MSAPEDILSASLGDVLGHIASELPSPAGGSAAAIAVAMGAGLTAMCARNSGDEWPEARGAIAQAETLRARIEPLAQADAEAYENALAAFRLPELLEPEVRNATLGVALERAAAIPLAIAEVGADVADLAADLAAKGNPRVRGDAVAGALLAEAGTRAAAHLVRINLGATPEDVRVIRADANAEAASRSVRRALGSDHE
jgi:formiminotetrahydrofolate cyclodeaminase